MNKPHIAYLGLGSNLGDKKANLDAAVEALAQHNAITLLKTSSYYSTEPVGYTEQDWFLNAAIKIETALDPHGLLSFCNSIERALGREKTIPMGPRIIDLDLLLFNKLTFQDNTLTLPHPEMLNRAFVMIPLLEIAPDLDFGSAPQAWKTDTAKVEALSKQAVEPLPTA
tara:strand:- start:68624 stop:69130 length:507 start_codon:yes stop_codon:yes gene_type:complete